MPSAEERFRAKVEVGDDHDRWTGSRDHRGVGMVRIDGKLRTVQRAAWEFANGPLPDGARVSTCAGERACVRVEHLSVTGARTAEASPPPKRRRRRGTGSVREVRPGVWRIVATDPSLGRGSPRRSLTVHGRRGDADAALERLVAATTRNDLGDLRVRELVGRHLDWRGDDLDDPDRSTLQHVLDPILGRHLAGMLTPLEITADLAAAHRSGLDRTEVRDALGLLHRAYRWAASQGWCAHNPAEDITVRDII